MTLAADRVSRLQLAGSRLNPVDPIAPNAAAALLRGLEPFVWRVRQAVVDKELGFWVARRIDKTLHMAAADQNELHLTAEQMRAGVDRRPCRFPQARLPARTRGVSHRSASPVCWRLRSGGGPLARGLRHRWRRGYRPASPLSGDGLAGRRAERRSTGRRHTLCAALPEGRHRRGAVRAPANCSTSSTADHRHDSLYFAGVGGQTLGQRGFSKDHQPDLNQMILAVLLDGDGRPVCTEMWPGNTADVGSPSRWSIGCASAFPFNASASSPIAA